MNRAGGTIDSVVPTIPKPVFLSTNINVENFKCPLCYEVALDPVKTPCNHLFCRSCITTHLQSFNGTKNFCPIDRESLYIDELSNIPPSLSRTWNAIPISCPKCVQWKGTLQYYKNHLKTCVVTPYVKDLEQRLKDNDALHDQKMREKDEIIRKMEEEMENCRRHYREPVVTVAPEPSVAVVEFDRNYRYNYERVVELSQLICRYLEDKPYEINSHRIFNCVKNIYDDYCRGYSDNPEHYDQDVRMLLSICYSSSWFTPNQFNRIREWVNSLN